MRKLLATLATGLLIGAGIASPAQAAYADCSPFNYPGTICFTEHGDYSGQVWRQLPSQIFGCRDLYHENFNDKASTFFNNTSSNYQLYLYQHIGCGGYDFIVASGQSGVFNGGNAWWNDKVSSIRIVEF